MSESDNEVVKVFGREVVLDKDLFRFNEASLNDFLQSTAANYSSYNEILAEANSQLRLVELNYETAYWQKMHEAKSGKLSDKAAEALARIDPNVVALEKKKIVAKRIVEKVKGFLRSWDLATQNAWELARTLRREMDKLGLELKGRPVDSDLALARELDEMFKGKPNAVSG